MLKTSGDDGTAAERELEQVSKVSLGAIDYERYKVGLMRSDIAGAAVLAAGLSQISRWKAHQLQCCSHRLEAHASSDVSRAWIDGLRLRMSCVCCCAPLTTLLVVFGLMDVRVMTIVTIATALERSQRIGVRVARLTGVVAAATGAWLLARAAL